MKNNFLISQPKHMLWVLKRLNVGKKIFTIYVKKLFISKPVCPVSDHYLEEPC